MDAREKFTGLASVYTQGRPAYAEAFLTDLYGAFGISADSVIADIGSGTGKFAKQLLKRGSFVYCVEPNEDMRNQAVLELDGWENARILPGDASHTTLPDSSVDFVTAAQAFHWFDTDAFRKECGRILKPGGRVFLIWNLRDPGADVTRKCGEVYRKYCPAFQGFTGGMREDDPRIGLFFDGKFEKRKYDHPLRYDHDRFISRCLSGSYSLKPGEPDYEAYLAEFYRIFDEYACQGVVTVPNETIVYAGGVFTGS